MAEHSTRFSMKISRCFDLAYGQQKFDVTEIMYGILLFHTF